MQGDLAEVGRIAREMVLHRDAPHEEKLRLMQMRYEILASKRVADAFSLMAMARVPPSAVDIVRFIIEREGLRLSAEAVLQLRGSNPTLQSMYEAYIRDMASAFSGGDGMDIPPLLDASFDILLSSGRSPLSPVEEWLRRSEMMN